MNSGLRRSTVIALSLAFLSSTAWAEDPPNVTVTQEQFKAWTDWTKKAILNLDQREKKLETKPPGEEEVDLSAPSATTTTKAEEGVGGNKGLRLETYFDLNFVNQPGTYDALAFDNYHSLVFFNLTPVQNINFSFNLLGPQTYPIYYELDYQASKTVTLRAGKIWIPFDDLSPRSPHNIFGGREGLQQLMPSANINGQNGNGGNTFLPSLWTELGVGLTYMMADTPDLQLQTDATITNGFNALGTDPVTGGAGPNFSVYTPAPTAQGAGSATAHRNKSVALRAHALIKHSVGLGVSYYTGQWNNDQGPNSDPGHLFLNMIGLDAQVYFPYGIVLRGGVARMNVMYPEATAQRGGEYLELGIPFHKRWKFLARTGALSLDNRIAEPTDMTLVGGTLIYNTETGIQFSLEHSEDIKNPGVPVGFTSYSNLRMIMLF